MYKLKTNITSKECPTIDNYHSLKFLLCYIYEIFVTHVHQFYYNLNFLVVLSSAMINSRPMHGSFLVYQSPLK